MIDPEVCDHDQTEPVYAYLRASGHRISDPIEIANGGRPVARICLFCHAQLHAGWGCPACTWDTTETRRLCDPHPTQHHALVRPCKEHA